MQFIIKPFVPETASEELWNMFFDLSESIRKEIYPDDPLPSRDVVQKSILLSDPLRHHFRWIALRKDDNKLIGYARLEFHKESAPAYEENKTQVFADLFVQKELRRKGIGTELLKIMLVKAKQENKLIFQSWGFPKVSTPFFEKFGGKQASKEEENRLKLADVDWDLIEKWRIEGPLEAKGVTLERFETVPEQDLEEFCRFFTEVLNQVPKEELEWEVKETPEVRREYEERNRQLRTVWTTIISKEQDGTISGLTETYYYPERKTIISQGLTGVGIPYRGRGLGKWLKAEMLIYIRDKFPQVTTIGTDFALVNDPMISINRRLGFKPYSIWIAYKFPIHQLLERINTKKKK